MWIFSYHFPSYSLFDGKIGGLGEDVTDIRIVVRS